MFLFSNYINLSKVLVRLAMDWNQEDDGPIEGQVEANVSDTNTIVTIFQAARENRIGIQWRADFTHLL